MIRFLDKDAVMVVTGGSGAIGLEIAIQAAELGARIVLHGSRTETCEGALAKIRERVPDAPVVALPLDLRAPGAATALVEWSLGQWGSIDILVHCAAYGPGGNVSGLLANTDPSAYAAFLDGGVASFQALCHAALPALKDRKGSIIAFASDSGLFAAPRQSLGAARMAAIIAFVRNLALETARDGVRVNCISPSFVEGTPIFERFLSAGGGRAERSRERAGLGLPTPADIAALALFLSGPAAAKITGQTISINGGLNA